MPPRTQLVRWGQQSPTKLLCGATTALPRGTISQHRRPAALTPSPWRPVVRTGAIRAHHPCTGLAQQCPGSVASPRSPPPEHGHPTRHCPPEPPALVPWPPARLIAVRHGWLVHIGARCLHWRDSDRCRSLLPVAHGSHTHGDATYLLQRLLRRTRGQALRPWAQRDRRVHARPGGATRNASRPRRARGRATNRAHQWGPLLCGDDWLERGTLHHWMTNRRSIVSRSGGLAAAPLVGLEDDHLIDCVHRHQGARLAEMARLPSTTALPAGA